MKTTTKFYLGKTFLVSIFVCIGVLLYAYANIACSTMPDNLLGINYEPSGIQMLYYVFVTPVFAIISLLLFLIKKYMTNESKIISIFPLVLTASLYFLLEYVDYVVHFPKGNDLFYKGSLILVLMFSFINLWCLVKETKGILKRRSDE